MDIDMSTYLVFDTETSSLYTPNYTRDHPNQARIMQIAMILYSGDNQEMGTSKLLIRIPDASIVHEKAQERHGIPREHCSKFGIPIEAALMVFESFKRQADIIVGHGVKFDLDMIAHECATVFGDHYGNGDSAIKRTVCTMNEMTPICKLGYNGSRAQNGKYKWPKLAEAYSYITQGESFDKAHDAFADCRATARIFKWLKDNSYIN